MRHLRALPKLRGLWRIWPDDGDGRWMIPADSAAEAMGIPYLTLRPGHPGIRLQAVGS